jgi:flagellar biosynthesis regulator FlbT
VIDSCTSRFIEAIKMAEDAGAEKYRRNPAVLLSSFEKDEIIRHSRNIDGANSTMQPTTSLALLQANISLRRTG